jgi:type VI secretion system secreted protein Hcp
MAIDMFIKIDDIKGEAQDAKHKESIDVLSWSWGMSQSGSMHVGGGGGTGKVAVQDLAFTKYVDAATSPLIQAACNAKHYKKAVLTVRKGGENPLEYIKIELSDLLVASLQTGGAGSEDRLTENVTLNFAKFKFEYQPQDAKGGKLGGAIEAGWDIAANKKM